MAAWTGDWAEIDGLNLNGVDEFGVKWGIDGDKFDGWGSTSPTLEMMQRTRQSGGWAGDSFGKPRTLAISGWVTGPTAALLVEAENRLIAATSRDERLLRVSEAGVVRWITVRRAGEVIFDRHRPTYATWSILVSSEDWRKFGTELVGSTALPATSGGLVIPFTIPFTIDATVTAGLVTLTNDGNETGPSHARVDGPAIGPIITHRGSGLSLVFASSLELLAGEWLDIDFDNHTALANGQASRATYITSRGWPQFEPGANQWAFTASSYTPGALLTVYGTPADE